MSRAAYLARLERERLARVAQQGRARLEARQVAEGVVETIALSVARGAEFEAPPSAPGERQRPYRRLAGLEWLSRKGRLTTAQKAAGERYGRCYRVAQGEVAIASTLDVRPGGAAETPLTAVIARAEANARARDALNIYRETLRRQPSLVAACDMICGEELTPREAVHGGDREIYRLEAVLEVALDMLAAEKAA
ncbi:hypothetical protein LJR164_001405 [Phenylobacterium sp. LjRoot164]|uniref:hypothetical protein n=1 Tax=unclassified Phenylobacterium TaxID=2640670 RepID=UPI003ECFBA17